MPTNATGLAPANAPIVTQAQLQAIYDEILHLRQVLGAGTNGAGGWNIVTVGVTPGLIVNGATYIRNEPDLVPAPAVGDFIIASFDAAEVQECHVFASPDGSGGLNFCISNVSGVNVTVPAGNFSAIIIPKAGTMNLPAFNLTRI